MLQNLLPTRAAVGTGPVEPSPLLSPGSDYSSASASASLNSAASTASPFSLERFTISHDRGGDNNNDDAGGRPRLHSRRESEDWQRHSSQPRDFDDTFSRSSTLEDFPSKRHFPSPPSPIPSSVQIGGTTLASFFASPSTVVASPKYIPIEYSRRSRNRDTAFTTDSDWDNYRTIKYLSYYFPRSIVGRSTRASCADRISKIASGLVSKPPKQRSRARRTRKVYPQSEGEIVSTPAPGPDSKRRQLPKHGQKTQSHRPRSIQRRPIQISLPVKINLLTHRNSTASIDTLDAEYSGRKNGWDSSSKTADERGRRSESSNERGEIHQTNTINIIMPPPPPPSGSGNQGYYRQSPYSHYTRPAHNYAESSYSTEDDGEFYSNRVDDDRNPSRYPDSQRSEQHADVVIRPFLRPRTSVSSSVYSRSTGGVATRPVDTRAPELPSLSKYHEYLALMADSGVQEKPEVPSSSSMSGSDPSTQHDECTTTPAGSDQDPAPPQPPQIGWSLPRLEGSHSSSTIPEYHPLKLSLEVQTSGHWLDGIGMDFLTSAADSKEGGDTPGVTASSEYSRSHDLGFRGDRSVGAPPISAFPSRQPTVVTRNQDTGNLVVPKLSSFGPRTLEILDERDRGKDRLGGDLSPPYQSRRDGMAAPKGAPPGRYNNGHFGDHRTDKSDDDSMWSGEYHPSGGPFPAAFDHVVGTSYGPKTGNRRFEYAEEPGRARQPSPEMDQQSARLPDPVTKMPTGYWKPEIPSSSGTFQSRDRSVSSQRPRGLEDADTGKPVLPNARSPRKGPALPSSPAALILERQRAMNGGIDTTSLTGFRFAQAGPADVRPTPSFESERPLGQPEMVQRSGVHTDQPVTTTTTTTLIRPQDSVRSDRSRNVESDLELPKPAFGDVKRGNASSVNSLDMFDANKMGDLTGYSAHHPLVAVPAAVATPPPAPAPAAAAAGAGAGAAVPFSTFMFGTAPVPAPRFASERAPDLDFFPAPAPAPAPTPAPAPAPVLSVSGSPPVPGLDSALSYGFVLSPPHAPTPPHAALVSGSPGAAVVSRAPDHYIALADPFRDNDPESYPRKMDHNLPLTSAEVTTNIYQNDHTGGPVTSTAAPKRGWLWWWPNRQRGSDKQAHRERKRRGIVSFAQNHFKLVLIVGIIIVILLILLGVGLGLFFHGKTKKASDQNPTALPPPDPTSPPLDQQHQAVEWVNLTGYPAIPTGILTIAQTELKSSRTGCVNPSTMWSCALPKELQPLVKPNKPTEPNFRIEIRYDRESPLTGKPSRRDLAHPRAVEHERARWGWLRRQQDPALVPFPAQPSEQDRAFLGRTTDNVSEPFQGENTPFYISFLDPYLPYTGDSTKQRRESKSNEEDAHAVSRRGKLDEYDDRTVQDEEGVEKRGVEPSPPPTIQKRASTVTVAVSATDSALISSFGGSMTTVTRTPSSSSPPSKSTSSSSVPDLRSAIPPPATLPDGMAAPANLFPLPTSQPLLLFNRGQPDEHYGFYTYFDRSLFLKSVTIVDQTAPGDGDVRADQDGGSVLDGANSRCTWAQTRFVVQIWTRGSAVVFSSPRESGGGTESVPSPPTPSAGSASVPGPPSVPYPLANDLVRPGSFPYPVTIRLDRHGGDPAAKMIYLYGLDERGRIEARSSRVHVENRAFGGVAVNPAAGPFRETVIDVGAGGPGGMDGGSGGCLCEWVNWR